MGVSVLTTGDTSLSISITSALASHPIFIDSLLTSLCIHNIIIREMNWILTMDNIKNKDHSQQLDTQKSIIILKTVIIGKSMTLTWMYSLLENTL